MNTILRNYRLLLALASGFLVLAMQVPGAASAFAHGVAPGGSINSAFAPNTTIDCTNPPVHDDCHWGGNMAYGARGTYREASVEFRVPGITYDSYPNARVSIWAGLGGYKKYAGSSVELVQAGIESYVDSNGGNQYNYAWYEYTGTNGSVNEQRLHFNNGLHVGDKIFVQVDSNYQHSGFDYFYIKNETTSESNSATVTSPLSDSATGECIGERPNANGGTPPLADFGTEWLNDCQITTDQTTKHVGVWPTYWVHIVDPNGNLLEGIGGIDSNGSFPLYSYTGTIT